MRYNVTLTFSPDELLQKFADSQGIPIEDIDLDVEEILEQEISTALDDSRIYVLSVEPEREIIGRTSCCMSPIYK